MLELRSELGVVLSVVHFNHTLRGPESDADERFVAALAEQNALFFASGHGDVKEHAKEKRLSLETAARELRYEFFSHLIASGDLDRVATAHTLDDQAETVLLKLARGAGTRGLAGIYPEISFQPLTAGHQFHDEIGAMARKTCGPRIVRPLLATARSTLQEYLSEIKQTWREDSSNCDLRHTRNRIRHEILPQLEESLNPSIRKTLADAAEIARGEEEYWAPKIAVLIQQGWKAQENGGVLDRELVRAQPLAVQRRLVRAATELFGLSLTFQHVEDILGLTHDGAQAALPDNWTATLQKSAIYFGMRQHDLTQGYEYRFKIPATVSVREAGVIIEAELVNGEGSDAELLLTSSLSGKEFVVRNWWPGDRFWPAHSKQPKKIKELLQDRHITGEAKMCWPVVTCGEEVVWVRGLGMRRDFEAMNGAGVAIRAVELGT